MRMTSASCGQLEASSAWHGWSGRGVVPTQPSALVGTNSGTRTCTNPCTRAKPPHLCEAVLCERHKADGHCRDDHSRLHASGARGAWQVTCHGCALPHPSPAHSCKVPRSALGASAHSCPQHTTCAAAAHAPALRCKSIHSSQPAPAHDGDEAADEDKEGEEAHARDLQRPHAQGCEDGVDHGDPSLRGCGG